MVDYDKASGEGTLRIRDLGSTIEFWVKPYYSSFYWTNLKFNWTANGTTTAVEVDFSGNAWKKVGSRTVTSSTTVTFKLLTATGTSSLGGPTTHAVEIDRGTVPPAPDAPSLTSKTDSEVTATFTTNGDGGLPLDDWEVSRSVSTSIGPTFKTGSDRSVRLTGLTPGGRYYFWSRVHNAKGWSPWSARVSTTMWRVPYAPTNLQITDVTQNSVMVTFTDGDNGGGAISSRDIMYGVNSGWVGSTTIPSDGSTLISDLLPGRVYYFRVRANNAYGEGDFSAPVSVQLIAGASVTYNDGTAKRAVPWVNVAGVWKVARPWGRIAGNWNKSAT